MNICTHVPLRPLAVATHAAAPSCRGLLQRKCACGDTHRIDGECADCRKKRLSPQGKTQSLGPGAQNDFHVPPMVHEVLRSPGKPLDPATRTFMEPRLGYDFSRVRVHTDEQAAESAYAVNALAYTVGHDVVFGLGRYAPMTSDGRRLLAHELTHVIQQRGEAGTMGRKPDRIMTDFVAERDADETAARLSEDKPSTRIHPGISPQLQRQENPEGQGQPAQGQPPTQSKAAQLKDKHFDTSANVEDLSGILWHELRSKYPSEAIAIGWVVINRMLILNTTKVSSLVGGNQFETLAGAPLNIRLLARMLLGGQYEDTTNGSFYYIAPMIMPDAQNQGCCSGKPGPCNAKRFQSGVDCGSGLQTVPGTDPPQVRFFPSFARADKRQPQPEGTDPMVIQVYRR